MSADDNLSAYTVAATEVERAQAVLLRKRVEAEIAALHTNFLSVNHPLMLARDLCEQWIDDYRVVGRDFMDWINLLYAVEELLMIAKQENE